jgi:hypothetical protein
MLLADISDDDKKNWQTLAEQIDNFAIQCCSNWQHEYLSMKEQDMRRYAEIQGKQMEYSITTSKLIIIPTAFTMERFINESRDIEHCQCSRLLGKEIKEVIKTAKTNRSLNLLVRQLAVSFNNLKTNFYQNY